jgi:hypothetical protein
MLYITRHGLRLDKVFRKLKGISDPPIHQSGIEQLIKNSKKNRKIRCCFLFTFCQMRTNSTLFEQT